MSDTSLLSKPGPAANMINFDQKSSEELMDLVVTGNESAFAELMRRHYPRSYAAALRLMRDNGLAQDIAQEAFIRVWNKSHLWQNRNSGSFSAWLLRITTNLAIDEQRRPSHQERFFNSIQPPSGLSEYEPNIIEELADHQPNPEKFAAGREIGLHIQSALAKLPPRQCQAFMLCQIEGESNADAARHMGVSVGALELLLVRARRSMRKYLADLYETENLSRHH